MATEFDDRLLARLTAFQQHHGMTGDGVAGPATWQKLVAGAHNPAAGSTTDPAGEANHGGVPSADNPPAEPCCCGVNEELVVNGVPQRTDAEPDGLSGDVEEGEEEGAEIQLGSGGNHRQPTYPVPRQCRTNAKACFSISQRRVWLLRHGRVIVASFPGLGGRPGFETPTGQFNVYFKQRSGHYSTLYHVEMPFYVKYGREEGFHQGSLAVMSHGCVHLSRDNAERTFDYLDYGDHVDILP